MSSKKIFTIFLLIMMVLNRVPTMKNLGKLNRPCSSRSVEIFVHYPILDQPPDFEQIRNLGGHVLNQYEEIHLLYIKIPINNLSRIKDLNGLNVFPDTQYKGLRHKVWRLLNLPHLGQL